MMHTSQNFHSMNQEIINKLISCSTRNAHFAPDKWQLLVSLLKKDFQYSATTYTYHFPIYRVQ